LSLNSHVWQRWREEVKKRNTPAFVKTVTERHFYGSGVGHFLTQTCSLPKSRRCSSVTAMITTANKQKNTVSSVKKPQLINADLLVSD
jgi:uncharacterized Fe-S center protein